MNKAQLIDTLAVKVGSSKEKANQFISVFTKLIEDALADKREVKIVGFGSFATQKRAARSGRNPSTGERIPFPEKLLPVFKPSIKLKEKIH
ncbi:MAG: HU family DNA-binding protein [Oligoflexales bacterium]|nr:HU family DNA-binding protein [Oligoflexales bacterium]